MTDVSWEVICCCVLSVLLVHNYQIKQAVLDLRMAKNLSKLFQEFFVSAQTLQVTLAARGSLKKVLLQNYTTVIVWYKNRQ